jgi:hypothetical protein
VPIQVAGLPLLFPQESGSLAMFTAAASHSEMQASAWLPAFMPFKGGSISLLRNKAL